MAFAAAGWALATARVQNTRAKPGCVEWNQEMAAKSRPVGDPEEFLGKVSQPA